MLNKRMLLNTILVGIISMDSDKIIAGVLIVAAAFLLVSFLGVLAITGFILAFSNPSSDSGGTPLIDSAGANTGLSTGTSGNAAGAGASGTGASGSGGTGASGTGTNPTPPPAPVCGNGTKET